MVESVQDIKRRAVQAAMKVLTDHWVDAGGECALPVDATIVAERAGAEVFLADLTNWELDGSIYIPPRGQGRPQITINQANPVSRRRFTCAHELGHMMDPRTNDYLEIGYTDNRDSLSAAGTDPREIFANTFAAALLMPSDEVEWLASEMDLYALARRFRVSTEAMVHRLKNLGIAIHD
jgi:Zn-dependent peptidase ImmA (M78 family)